MANGFARIAGSKAKSARFLKLVFSPLEHSRGSHEENNRDYRNYNKVYCCLCVVAVYHYPVESVDYVEEGEDVREVL